MSGFRGTYQITLDAKGRIAVPAKYRAALKDMVIAPNPFDSERCLLVYTLEQWQRVEQGVLARNNTKQKRYLIRHFLGGATECSPDTGGRVLVPKLLREFASIDKKISMVGAGNKFELWSEELWKLSYSNYVEHVSEDEIAEELGEIEF